MPPAHRNALCAAVNEVYGVALMADHMGQTAGMTDTAIVRRNLLGLGVSDEVIAQGLPACFEIAAEHYERLVPDDLRAYHTPHAATTLAWLAGRGAALGLVTGNVARIAAVKLAAAGLADFFPTAPVAAVAAGNASASTDVGVHIASSAVVHVAAHTDADASPGARATTLRSAPNTMEPVHRLLYGGFGDEGEAREALPPLALARALRVFGRSFAPAHVYVVGDTPADIACGAAHGLRTVGVATGQHALAELHACQPDYTLTDLSELRSFVWE
jgi:phosphoglycolate phosphatase-like HAD superfamily hydrolase